MIGGNYSYDFPPLLAPTLPQFHEEPAPYMDDSQRPAEEEEEEVLTATADSSPSVRPRRKKLRYEVW